MDCMASGLSAIKLKLSNSGNTGGSSERKTPMGIGRLGRQSPLSFSVRSAGGWSKGNRQGGHDGGTVERIPFWNEALLAHAGIVA